MDNNESLIWTKLKNGIVISTIYRKSSAITVVPIYYYETMVFDKPNGSKILDEFSDDFDNIAFETHIRQVKKYFTY